MIAAVPVIPLCPVVHTTLNWVVMGLLFAVIVLIFLTVVWGAYERHLERRSAAGFSLGEFPPPAPRAGPERHDRGRW